MTANTLNAFHMNKNDRRQALRAVLSRDGVAVNLTGLTVVFDMYFEDGTKKIDGSAATLEDPPNGVVNYSWGATDTNTAGRFTAYFRITDGGGESFPNDGKMLHVVIHDPTAPGVF